MPISEEILTTWKAVKAADDLIAELDKPNG